MRNLLPGGKDVKARRARVKQVMDLRVSAVEPDIRVQLLQELIP
jgi:hypothetical protein